MNFHYTVSDSGFHTAPSINSDYITAASKNVLEFPTQTLTDQKKKQKPASLVAWFMDLASLALGGSSLQHKSGSKEKTN